MLRKLLIAAALLIVLAGAGFGWAMWRYYRDPGPLTAETTVVIPRGSGALEIAYFLEDNGVLRHPHAFRLLTFLLGMNPRLQAGEYRFMAGITPDQIIRMLVSGDTVKRSFTVAEGLTSAQIMALLKQAGGMEGDVPDMLPEEGTLLPETYYYVWGVSREDMLERMRAAMQAALDELWPQRDASVPLSTLQEAVILASIVEKETSLPEERGRVAAVFVNRLKQGMPLQTDPTVIYALTAGENKLERPLTYADLKTPSPYNTYLNPGLPPGPICHPGRAALEAVLHPSDTDDLYFVADGSGGHAFARTAAEHLRNVRAWRKKRKEMR